MKNKTKTYLLLVAVLTIWGIIGFKIMSTINPDAPEVSHHEDMAAFTPKSTIAVDTFSIRLTERDPFLGTLSAEKKVNSSPKTNRPIESVEWMPIIYHGTVSKQNSKEKVCVLSINGQQHIMKVGQEKDGIKLLKADNKAVSVSYKGMKKSIDKT